MEPRSWPAETAWSPLAGLSASELKMSAGNQAGVRLSLDGRRRLCLVEHAAWSATGWVGWPALGRDPADDRDKSTCNTDGFILFA